MVTAQYIEQDDGIEQLKEEARTAWLAYQQTGLHLTGTEVSNWMKTWGTEGETELPECHR